MWTNTISSNTTGRWYDDIDFIADITRDELIEVGVSKYAHLKRLMKSIGQLLELTDSGTASANSK